MTADELIGVINSAASATINSARIVGIQDGDKGDITVSGAGGTWTIDNNAVTLAKMADMATASLIYRTTAGTGDPEVNTLATLKTDLGLTGTNSGDQTITLTGDVTGSGTGSFTTAIGAGVIVDADVNASAAIALSKLATQGARTFVANSTASTAVPTAISVATAQGMVGQFDTVAAVNSATIDAGINHIRTAGYYANGDGGGALYKRVASGSTGVGTPRITSNGGAVIFELAEQTVSVLMCGAVGDGTTNDAAAFNAALSHSLNVYVPDVANGYRLNSTVTLNTGNSLIGDEHRSKIIHGGSSDCFTIAGNNVAISGLFVDATNNTAGNTFFINTTASRERILIRNIYTLYGNGLLTDSNSTGIIVTLKLQDVQARYHEGRGVYLRDAFAFIELQNVLVDYLNVASPTNQTAYEIVGVEGVSLINVEATGSYATIAGTTTSQRGYVFTSCKAVYIYRAFADNLGGIGFDFTSCDFVRMDNSTASLCDNYGIRLATTNNFVATNVYVGGRSASATKTASIDGVFVTSSSQHVVFTGIQVRSCTGNGFVNNGGTNIVVSGGELLGNTGRGLVCSGSGTVTLVTGVQFVGNTAGDYTLLTANDIVSASQINAGTVVHSGLTASDTPTFAGVVTGDGTAAAPALRGTDTDSGVFHGANFVGLTAGGNEIVRANATGLSLNTGRSFGFKTASVNFTASLLTGGTDGMIWNSDSSLSYFQYQVNSLTRLELNNTGIGFFGATPVARPTVGAALSTGGSETNTNLATRINEIRTALINLGLVT
jgi:hypothetical protein